MLGLLVLTLVGAAGTTSAAPLLRDAETAYRALDYDKVLPLVEKALEIEGTPLAQRLRAFELQGSCLAIMGRMVEAERPFRLLLRAQPDFDLSKSTSPKIVAVFRKVQADEREIATELAAVERKRLLESMQLTGKPEGTEGGQPVAFHYQLDDPRGAAAGVELRYRRIGAGQFSALALEPDGAGNWNGILPGEWTASPTGFVLEYFARSFDRDSNDLVTDGSATEPLKHAIDPGELELDTPLLESGWFWGVAALLAAGGAATAILLASQGSGAPQTDLGEITFP